MTFTSKGTSEILVAGLQNTMFTIDLDKGRITKEVGVRPACGKLVSC
jgi:PAB-dependent poly(A)-specific ribonuclease subunit 2